MAKGRKTGGRVKGTPNRRKAAEALLIEGGTSPLAYLLEVMRDRKVDIMLRLTAAKAAAPYVHQALKAVEVSGPAGEPVESKVVISWMD